VNLRYAIRDRRHTVLLKAARRGDEKAFRRLYDELYGPLAGYLTRRVNIPQDAEDLISTVFHRFLQNLERYDADRGSVQSWVMTMARHALIDHLRRHRETQPIENLAEVLAGPLNAPLDGLIRTEEADRVRELVRTLPPETREMISLRYGQGLRHREIGNLLGLNEAAVKQRISRALQELRRRANKKTMTGGEVDFATR